MQPLRPGPRYTAGSSTAIKIALFDVDNTLIGNESSGLPTERFKSAVDAARGRIMTGIATARPLAKVAHILDYIDAEGFSILCNGAQILRNRDKVVVAEWPIKLQTCTDLLGHIKELNITYWINDDGTDYFTNRTDGASYEKQVDMWDHHSQRVAVPDYRPSKPLVIVLHDINDAQLKDIEQFVESHSDTTLTSLVGHQTQQPDGSFLYDVFLLHKLANKKDALHEVARLQAVPVEEIMAVGDGRNDAVIVAEAGVGIAMGNSAKETLAVATYIAPDQVDDGAAVALEFALANLA